MAIKPYSYLLGIEQTCGTTPTGADLKPWDMCISEDGITCEAEYGDAVQCFGDVDAGGEQDEVGLKIGGSVTTKGYYEQLPIFLKLILGNGTDADNGDGTFTHTYKSSTDNQLCAYAQTIVGKNDEHFSIVNGLKADKLSINIEKRKSAEFSVSFLGGKYDDNVKNTALAKLDEANKIALSKTPIVYRSVEVKIDDVADCNLNSISVDIDRGLKEYDALCKDEKSDIEATQLAVTGKLQSVWTSDLYAKLFDGNKHKVEITVYGKNNNKIYIKMSEVQFKCKTQPKKVNERYDIDIEFNAAKITGTDKVEVAVTNTVASY